MMTMIVSDDEEFASRWKRSRCDYLREVFVVFSLAFLSLTVHCYGMPNGRKRRKRRFSCKKKEEKN
jgi:hypothetical protein